MKPPSPQLKYMREARADPLFRAYELERQKERRNNPIYKAKAAAYWKLYKERKKDAYHGHEYSANTE